MQRPYRFTIICNKTGKTTLTDFPPRSMDLETWEPVEGAKGQFELKQTKTAYIDTRYEARIRLWRYVTHGRYIKYKRNAFGAATVTQQTSSARGQAE